LNKIYSPIGIDIKSETPAEIAISIAAQIIEIKHRFEI
jgi:xanthine dehydrogenase accessory factor